MMIEGEEELFEVAESHDPVKEAHRGLASKRNRLAAVLHEIALLTMRGSREMDRHKRQKFRN